MEDLSALMAQMGPLASQFGPTQEDKDKAKWLALMGVSAGLLGARRGQVFPALGQGLLNGIQMQQSYLQNAGKERQQGLAAASSLLNLQKQMQMMDMQRQWAQELSNAGKGAAPTPGTPAGFQIPSGAAGVFEAQASTGATPEQQLSEGRKLPTAAQGEDISRRQRLVDMNLRGRALGMPDMSGAIRLMYPNPIPVAEGGALFDPATQTMRPNPKSPPGSFYDPATNSYRPVQNFNELNAAAIAAEERARRQVASDFTLREFPRGPQYPGQTEWMTESQYRNQRAMPPASVPSGESDKALRDAAGLGINDPVAAKAAEIRATTPAANNKQSIGALNEDFIKNSYRTALDYGKAATERNASLDLFDRLSIKDKTGWGANAMAGAANVLARMGVRDAAKFASEAQIFNREVFNHNWTILQQQKGVQTEGDSQRALKTWAQLENTPEANQFAIDFARATNRLLIRHRDYYVSNLDRAKRDGDLSVLETEWSQKAPSIWEDPAMQKWKNYGEATGSAGGLTPAEQKELDTLRQRFGR